MTRGTEGTPVDFSSLAIGSSLGATGDKTQQLQTELWNLDRIHQRDLPLDSKFVYGSNTTSGTGKGVTIYVVDSGIMPSHQEFQSADGSGSRASFGYDFVEDDEDSTDCDGHGTHVASTAVGLQVGVAKQTKVVSVRILDCDGSGTISDTVAGRFQFKVTSSSYLYTSYMYILRKLINVIFLPPFFQVWTGSQPTLRNPLLWSSA